MLKAMTILNAKVAFDKEWDQLKNMSAWRETEVESRKTVIEQAQKRWETVHFATLMDLCRLQNSELAGSCSEVMLSKTTLGLAQCSQSRDRQHHK